MTAPRPQPDLLRLLGPKILIGVLGALVSLAAVILLALHHYPDEDAACAKREPPAAQAVNQASANKASSGICKEKEK